MQRFSRYFLFNLLFLALAACSLPTARLTSTSAGPESWIDKPLDGSHFPLGPIEIVAHGADLGGVSRMEFSINGSLAAALSVEDASRPMATFVQTWTPPQPGNYSLQVRTQNTAGGWGRPAQATFTVDGELPEAAEESLPPEPAGEVQLTPTPTAEPEICSNRIQFAGETLPDNTVFAPGAAFTKTWTLVNAGTCPWTTAYQLAFFDGAAMGGANLPLHKEVLPGENIVLSINLIAPANAGTYQGWWLLQDDAGQRFGLGEEANAPFWVLIQVEAAEQTPGDPPPPPSGGSDTQQPVIHSLTFSPGSPTMDDLITFTVAASDNVGVVRIDIYFNAQGSGRSQPVHTCVNTTLCSYTGGLYAAGQYSYFAYAFDAAGNYVQSFVQGVEVAVIVK